MILKEFEKVDYLGTKVADIFRPLSFYSMDIEGSFILNQYTLRGNQQSEIIAFGLGGNPELTWINHHINQVIDPFWGWVNNETDIRQLAERRYDNPEGIHHYVNPNNGDEWYDLVEQPIDSAQYYDVGDTAFEQIVFAGLLIPITNYEFELSVNEEKRIINFLPSQSFIEYDSAMKQVIKANIDVNSQ